MATGAPSPHPDILQHLNGTFEPNYQSDHILSTRIFQDVFAGTEELLADVE